MTSIDKKLQQKGWDRASWKELRKTKLDEAFNEEPQKFHVKRNKKGKNYCYAFHGKHIFIPEEGKMGKWKPILWKKESEESRWVKCKGCGKKDWERRKIGE